MLSIIRFISRTRLGTKQNGNGMRSFVRFKHSISDEEKEMYVKWFKKLDSDQDGYITKKELTTGLKNIYKISEEDKGIDILVKQMDTDKSDLVSFDEFLTYLTERPATELVEETIERTFKVFDRDGDGRINRAELVATYSTLGHDLDEAQADALMKNFDTDSDGLITFHEFKMSLLPKNNK